MKTILSMLHFIAQAIYTKGPFCPYIYIIIGQGELEYIPSAQVLQNAYGLALLLLVVPYSCAVLGQWLEVHLFIPQLNKASGFLHHFAAIYRCQLLCCESIRG